MARTGSGFNFVTATTPTQQPVCRNNNAVALKVVARDGRFLEEVADADVVTTAKIAMKIAMNDMKCDTIVNRLRDDDDKGCASDRLKDDKDVMMKAVVQYGHALKYASGRLKDDKDVMMKAVAQYGHALKYASGLLKDDKDVARYGRALRCASNRPKDVVIA